jgi:predicted ferric reductase
MSASAPVRHASAPVPPRSSRHRSPDYRARLALRLLVPAGCLGVTAFWFLEAPSRTDPGTVVTGAGDLAGLLASFLVCVLLVLVSRAPWVERLFGLDHLVGWHRSLGASVVLLVVTHVVLILLGSALWESTSAWEQVPRLLATQPNLVEALIGTGIFLVAGTTSAQLVRRMLTYEAWLAVHLTLYVGIYLTFWHQINAGAHFAHNPVARVVWIVMYVAAGLTLVIWRVLLPLRRLARHVFQIEAVVPETPTTTNVWLRAKHLDELGVRGGQFFLVRFLARGHFITAHPYSVSMMPYSGRLRFTVRALGDHSKAVRNLRPGTRVLLEGPFGRFTADRTQAPRLLLIAGGAGVGPIRALAEDLAVEGRDVVVVHRARTPQELALAGELGPALGDAYIPLVGRRRLLGHDPLGPRSLRAVVPDASVREVFVCGPPGLIDAVYRTCRKLRIPPPAVHHEELSLS